MKKSLITLAVIGVFTSQYALADNSAVTVYGAANISFDDTSSGAVGPKVNNSANAVSSNASHIGFKGSEAMGDVTAVWQIEEQLNFVSAGGNATGQTNGTNTPVAGNSTFSARDTFAGLSSASLGTVIIGIHDAPYKMATRGLDVFANTVADNRSIMGTSFQPNLAAPVTVGDIRLNNVIAYISPAFSGLTLAVATVTGAEIPVTGSTTPDTKGNAWSFAALYGEGPLNVNFGYQTITAGSGNTGTLAGAGYGLNANDKTTSWKIGGGYTMDAFQLNAIFEKQSASSTDFPSVNGGNILDRTSWYLGGKYNVNASDTLKAAYTSAGNVAAVANSGVKQFSLGYDHGLSKYTTVYALYSKLSNDSVAGYTLGNPDANSSTISSNGGVGAAPSVFSLGMKHAF